MRRPIFKSSLASFLSRSRLHTNRSRLDAMGCSLVWPGVAASSCRRSRWSTIGIERHSLIRLAAKRDCLWTHGGMAQRLKLSLLRFLAKSTEPLTCKTAAIGMEQEAAEALRAGSE